MFSSILSNRPGKSDFNPLFYGWWCVGDYVEPGLYGEKAVAPGIDKKAISGGHNFACSANTNVIYINER